MVSSKPLVVFATFAFCLSAVAGPSVAKPSRMADSKERSRLEELFIWRTSEELKLAPADEQKFTDAIHELNKRRRDANAKMDAALAALASAKTKTEIDKALSAHKSALRETQASQNAELDRLRPLLGPEKLAKYLVAKNSILEKLKAMLAAPQAVAPLAAPASTSAAASSSPSGTLAASSLNATSSAASPTPSATPAIPTK